MLKGRHLVEPGDFRLEEMEEIFRLAERMMERPRDYAESCKGRILATLFFEPSTRTRLSFEAAMLRLGGGVIGFSEAGTSSAAKGESLADTVRTVSAYADLVAMRHPREGSALLASRHSGVPVINAGDGGHHHPTQTLTDLLTIRSLKGGFSGLKVGFCGDLKFGRTVHSLVEALARYPGNSLVLISPPELRLPDYVKRKAQAGSGLALRETESLEGSIAELDILYMTRIQKERFFNEEDYLRVKDSFILDEKAMSLASPTLSVLHPLPRVNEISPEVDRDGRAAYFDQVRFGMYARMALIASLLGAA